MDRVAPKLAALLLLAGASACTSLVAPTTRVFAPLDPGLERVLYVSTGTQREAILAELKLAGFASTSNASEASLVLVVRLGRPRLTKTCGSLRNVAYELRQAGVAVVAIKGRGWVGSCSPSILRDMNAVLAHLFDSRM